jgi:hypothetical protein
MRMLDLQIACHAITLVKLALAQIQIIVILVSHQILEKSLIMENAIATIIILMMDFLNVINAIILAYHVPDQQLVIVILVIQLIIEHLI